MALADMISNYPEELTCDMAETYGVFDIKRVPARLLATLAVGLRDDSRVKRAKFHTVDDQTMLLAIILDVLRGVEDPKDSKSARGYYLGLNTEPAEPEHEEFDSPEDFRKRWKEITRN